MPPQSPSSSSSSVRERCAFRRQQEHSSSEQEDEESSSYSTLRRPRQAMTNPARSSNENSNNLYRLSSGKIGKLDHRSKNIRRNGRPGGRSSDASSSSALSLLVLITSRRLIQFKSLIFLILMLQLFWLVKVYHHGSSSPLQPLDQNLKSHPYLFPQLRHERQQQSSLLSLQSSYSSPIGYTKITSSTRRLDIGVPVSGKAEAMDRFAKLFSQAMYDLRHNVDKGRFVQVRLILSRNADDDMSWEYRQRLKMHSGVDDVIFATEKTPSTKFSRAKAINTISKFACQQQQQQTTDTVLDTNSTSNETSASISSKPTKGGKFCVLGIVDVDMQVGVEFLVNSLNHVSPTNVYFPVVFSNYRPSNVALVEAFAGHPLEPFSEDTGWWRDHGYGMYSIFGTDIFKVTMNATKFQGWGKEDGDFYTRVINSPRKFNVIRWKEPGLIHLWHPKYCVIGHDVTKAELQRICMTVRKRNEGSATADRLNDLIRKNFDAFERKWRRSRATRRKDFRPILDMAATEYNLTLLELEQTQRREAAAARIS